MQNPEKKEIKLNLGCGGRPLLGYINIDLDTLEELKKRYPTQKFPKGIKIYQYNIFKLPFTDESVWEVKADALLEHLSFAEERQIFYEVKRVLKPGGLFDFSVPDFEYTVKLWLKTKDDWRDFYRTDKEAIKKKHWFGQYTFAPKSRWGYLTATIFGPQHGEGQFHKNCYTVPKIRAILEQLGFREKKISYFYWKGKKALKMIRVKAIKRKKRKGGKEKTP